MMLCLSLLFFVLVLGSIHCSGDGAPGSAPRFQSTGGRPGSIGGPSAQLVFPPNPEFGQLVKIDDPEEANANHIFSDPRGPIGILTDSGDYHPLRNPSAELRSKNQPQVRRDEVDENDWQRVESDTMGVGNNLPKQDTPRGRASTLYNMFNRRHQPGQGPREPEGPPRHV